MSVGLVHSFGSVDTALDDGLEGTKSQESGGGFTPSAGRERVRKKREQQLQEFLALHHFHDLSGPRELESEKTGCFGWSVFNRPSESMCPIHVAAERGNCKILRQLLEAGVDPTQQTSKGRTALDLAKVHGWAEAIEILENPVRPLKVREALRQMEAEQITIAYRL
ncbi:unnamed protein product [Durusdinium trenchii]|uniref:Uncharacterized protein n=1 Tax=Durusdinium trenchii TaxID=1381693 RepID=A0ABP0Q8M1_9DINO